MVKKFLAVGITLTIVIAWILTVGNIGGVGPINKYIKLGLDISGGVYVVMQAENLPQDQAEGSKIMQQTQSVIENRVNEMGLSEPVVTIEGDDRIRIELPGADDSDEAIQTIGKTAQLKFLLADGTEALSGADIKNSGVEADSKRAGYIVTLEFTADGADKFYEATSTLSGGKFSEEDVMEGPDGERAVTQEGDAVQPNSLVIMLDDAIISAPVCNTPIEGTSAIIEGNFTQAEAASLSMLIRGGALPVDLVEVESSSIGASIGMGALTNSVTGGIIGVLLIFLLLMIVYRLFGFAANLAMLLYIPMLLWWLVLSQAVLTLPGIAGIVLSIGMAIDANVIVISRIKEEVGYGKSLRVAAHDGYKKALPPVLDSQITTIIAAVVLYQFGTGPVKGFAFTLASGIIIGLFTALVIAKVYDSNFVEMRFLNKPFIMGVREGESDQKVQLKWTFRFIEYKKIFYIVTVAIIIIGLGVGFIRGFNYGIDFTGGTRLQIEVGSQVTNEQLQTNLRENGINNAEIVRYGNNNEGASIKTTKALDNEQRNKLIGSLEDEFGFTDEAVQSFEQFGPSIGEMLKRNAVSATLIAALGMLIYIIIRFRWRFGVASIVGVVHDAVMLLAFYGLLHLQINNPFIAAMLTVVGYSINDTIVIFDRIRENLGIMGRTPLPELIDTSINQTLVRSLMTSFSTILAILPLVIMGGETIRQFALPLMIGIICGAASSIFIASPIYYELTAIGSNGGRNRSKYLESQSKAASRRAKGAAPKSTKSDRHEDNKDDKETSSKQNQNRNPNQRHGKGQSKKSKKKRKSSKSGGAVV